MKFTWFFVCEGVWTEGYAVQASHGVAERTKGAADLAVATFTHAYFVRMSGIWNMAIGYWQLYLSIFHLPSSICHFSPRYQ